MEKTKYKVYYKDTRDIVLTKYDIEQAFYITTGKIAKLYPIEFMQYLHSILGVSIVKVKSVPEGHILYFDSKVDAVKRYREEHNCTLTEAHYAITHAIEDLFNEK